MAKLYFYYSAMNAGKTTMLLQSSYNYRERGMSTLIYTSEFDDRMKKGKVCSRIGIVSSAMLFNYSTNFFTYIGKQNEENEIHCVLIDECHFLIRKQVEELTQVVDVLKIPVLCYGLRTDFKGELFDGSLWLLAWADKLVELKTICYCGKQANRVLRIDKDGKVVRYGNQVMIGGNECYFSVCRKHFVEMYS